MAAGRYVSLFTLLLTVVTECALLSRTPYQMDGNVIIGGLIPLHNFDDSTEQCADRRDIVSLRLVEALVYAITKINEDTERLSGITLGYEIYDTCSSSSETLKNALAFIPSLRQNNTVLGVVGPQRSSSSLQATKLLGLYNISVVSYLSTSDELSNSDRYPYFFRMVPPDKFQVTVIFDLLTRYSWNYVSFIYSDDSYGINAKSEFLYQVEGTDICIGYDHSIPLTEPEHSLDKIITDLKNLRSTTLMSVVILFIHNEMATNLFRLADREGLARAFIWIGSDGWGNYGKAPFQGVEETALETYRGLRESFEFLPRTWNPFVQVLGAFTIVPKSGHMDNFNEYFRVTSINSENPWSGDFREEIDACRASVSECSTEGERPQFESKIVDAVEVLVLALSKEKSRLCDKEITPLHSADCIAKIIENRSSFKNSLLQVSFVSPSNGRLKFNSNGDASGQYDIRQFQKMDENVYELSVVGNWSEIAAGVGLYLNNDQVKWYLEEAQSEIRYTESNIPKSICNEPCGHREVTTKTGCCWRCELCTPDAIISNNHCLSCYDPKNNSYMWPNEDSTSCKRLPHIKTGDKPENIVIIIVSTLGLLLELVIFVLFVVNREKRLIRASSRELGFLIFGGVFLTYLSSILFSVQPSHVCCIVLRIIPYLGQSLIFVSIATMIVRLYRIFQAGKRSTKRPQFISPVSQVVLALTLSLGPMVWSIVWIFIQPPKVITNKVSQDIHLLIDSCAESSIHLIGQLFWQLACVLICCYFAILSRNLPANYNQSRFIAFTVFCSLVVFIAFTPAYFLSTVARAKNLYCALGGIILATVVLILLFIVRLYAVYFIQEEKQQAVTTQQSIPTITDDELPSNTKSAILKLNDHYRNQSNQHTSAE